MTASASSAEGWGNDDFAPFNADVKPASSYNWDSTPATTTSALSAASAFSQADPNSDSFFDDLPGAGNAVRKPSLNLSKSKSSSPKPGVPNPTSPPSASGLPAKMAAMETPSDDGWGSWDGGGGDESGASATTSASTKADLMKQKREQRKLEMEKKRMAKNAGGGAMKLGVRKVD